MRNLYEVLEIEKNATEQEIKKAYNKLLRKYPPEKEPEKYKEIREAYNTLRDKNLRKNYDAYFNHGEEIQKLEKEANELIEQKNYSEAETILKKILIISPEILHIKEMLGDVFLLEKKYDNSIKQFDSLIEECPNNSDYYFKRGQAYKGKYCFSDAEKNYIWSYSLDYGNLNAINQLVYLYIEKKQIEKAISFLNKEIYRDDSLDFEDFFCLSKLIECYVFKNDKSGLQKVIADIKKIAPEDEEIKKYMSWKLTKLALSIHEVKYHILAYEVIELAYDLYPSEEIEKIVNNLILYSSLEKMLEDKKITYSPLKGPILYYMYGEEAGTQEDRRKNLEGIFQNIREFNAKGLNIIKESLEYFLINYNLLYLERKEVYDLIKNELEKEMSRKDNFLNKIPNFLLKIIVYCIFLFLIHFCSMM